jgi:hypothetical protein
MERSKGRVCLVLLCTLLLLLGACAPAATPPAEPANPDPVEEGTEGTEGTGTPDDGGIPVPPEVRMIAQFYEGDDIIEVPEFVGTSEVIQSLNEQILSFAGDYEAFLTEDVESIELKCYPIFDEKYVQIIMTRALYPSYGTYGEIASFIYDYQEDVQLTANDASLAEGLEFTYDLPMGYGQLETKLENVFAPADAARLERVELVGCAASQEGTLYFCDVTLAETGDSDSRRVLVTRFPDGSYEVNDNGVPSLDLAQLLPFDPPLWIAENQG